MNLKTELPQRTKQVLDLPPVDLPSADLLIRVVEALEEWDPTDRP
ncbi:hypothetical protein [Nocardia nova]|nr:hypothetical protein [Nocardia nova]